MGNGKLPPARSQGSFQVDENRELSGAASDFSLFAMSSVSVTQIIPPGFGEISKGRSA